MLGVGWYKAFLRRNPVISIRTSEHVSAASANLSEFDIRKWFTDIYQYLTDENLENILKDPRRVFNGDESGFSLCPKTQSVLGPKGAKDVYEVATGNAKENLTVMFTFNAAGETCHPMVIFNYKRIPQNIIDSVPANWGIGRSDSGWMVSEVFYEFVANVFHPFLIQSGIEFPVILFVDGHKSHLTYHLSILCNNLKIILIALYPNATRILQPADVAAFRPLKGGWKKGVFEWRNENPHCAITKKDFAPILQKVINKTIRPEILMNGFKACGLYPWNPDQIDFRKCLGKKELTSTEKNIINNTADYNNLEYHNFTDIVGSEIMEKLNNIQDVIEKENHPEEFYVLYRLYEKLKKCTKNDDVEKNSISMLDNSDYISEDVDHYPNKNIETLERVETNSIIDNDIQNTTINYNISPLSNRVMEIQEENEQPCTFIKKMNLSPLETCLVWPITPERKGKRDIERVPFVITSQKWKHLYEEKANKKKNIAEEKEKKKMLKYDSKQNKLTNKINQKNNSQSRKRQIVRNLFLEPSAKKKPVETITSQSIEFLTEKSKERNATCIKVYENDDSPLSSKTTGKCFQCNGTISSNDIADIGFECTFCNNKFHKRCTNKNNDCDLLSNDDNILFICYMCEKEVNMI